MFLKFDYFLKMMEYIAVYSAACLNSNGDLRRTYHHEERFKAPTQEEAILLTHHHLNGMRMNQNLAKPKLERLVLLKEVKI